MARQVRRGQIIYCRGCGIGYPLLNTGELPKPCPSCDQPVGWTTVPPYHLSRNDATFLHSIKIDPETEA